MLTAIFDLGENIRVLQEMKFVEIRTKRFGVFAVVLRIRKDTLTFLRRGNKVNSTVDARISFTCKPGMFKNNVCFTSEVRRPMFYYMSLNSM